MIAPPTMTELTVGVVKGGPGCFQLNKEIFSWLHTQLGTMLDLPRPFMGKILGFPSKLSQVEKIHLVQRVELVANSATFDEFLKRKDEAGSVWTDIDKAVQIHHTRVDEEFDALEKIAKLPGRFDLATKFAETFGTPGSHPNPAQFRACFSAALEYAEAVIRKIKHGAKPRKNDRGVYGDFQLFFYLADPNINLLTQENFSNEIKHSPQRTRIVGLNVL